MNETTPNQQPAPEPGRARQPLDYKADFRNEVEPALAALHGAMDVLPAVDKQGRSDCPFASQLYRAMDKAAERVASLLVRVRTILARSDEEVARCEHRLEYIRQHANDLHDAGTRAEYDGAISAARKDLVSASQDQKAIKDTLARMMRALSYASRISYGNRQPGAWDPPASALPTGHTSYDSSPRQTWAESIPSAHGRGASFAGSRSYL